MSGGQIRGIQNERERAAAGLRDALCHRLRSHSRPTKICRIFLGVSALSPRPAAGNSSSHLPPNTPERPLLPAPSGQSRRVERCVLSRSCYATTAAAKSRGMLSAGTRCHRVLRVGDDGAREGEGFAHKRACTAPTEGYPMKSDRAGATRPRGARVSRRGRPVRLTT